MKKNLLYLSLSLLSLNANAQIPGERLYLPYGKPPVVYAENNRVLNFAWCGGANNPQLAMADLNQDNIKDLIIFDPAGGVKTFLNTSDTAGKPHYTYNPEFQANFPEAYGFVKLEDYNRDGIPDLFHRGYSGVTPLKGYYNSQHQLSFYPNTRFKGLEGLYYLTGGSGYVNVYVAPNDMPAIGDIDGDGDLDIISYDISGTNIYYYRNCQMETMPQQKDSFPICVKDGCWGKTAQLYARQVYMGINCGHSGETCKGCDDPTSAGKTTHSGNTLCLVDFDNDGDFDILNGNVSFSDIQYTRNCRKDINYPIDSMVAEDTIWASNGKAAFVPQMPAAYWLDLDNNGAKDLAFTPFLSNTENYKCIVYYKNMGTNAHPNLVYQSDTLFMQEMIDVGTGSSPVFYDYNKDGKPDMFIGSEGYYQASNGSMKASIQYYENTSTTGNPSFTLKSRDFMNLSGINPKAAMLSMGDLDGDGKDDLVMGLADGTVVYYKNNAATPTTQPIWQSPITLNDQHGTMDVGDYAAPCIYDINKDGKNDLVVGCQNGRLFYYKNLGSGTYNLITDTLGGIFLLEDGGSFTFLSPYIGRVDNTAKDYLMIGSANGIVYRYDNFQSGNTNIAYKRVDSFYSKINVRHRAKPTIADIDGDGAYEMAVGNSLGGVVLYKQYFNVSISDRQLANGGVEIYPNPAKNTISIGWLPTFATGDVNIRLISVTGQKLYEGTVDGSRTNAQIDISAFPSGTYYCIVRSAENQASSPVSIIK